MKKHILSLLALLLITASLVQAQVKMKNWGAKIAVQPNTKLNVYGDFHNNGQVELSGQLNVKGILQNENSIILKQATHASIIVYQTLLLHSGL
jgi:hypothetical protein